MDIWLRSYQIDKSKRKNSKPFQNLRSKRTANLLKVKLFIFRMFLSTTFIVFCIPELANDTYWSIVLIPYTLPLLQTTLSISVYITVLIAICTWLYIRPSQQQATEPEAKNDEESSPRNEGNDMFWLRKGNQLKLSITYYASLYRWIN